MNATYFDLAYCLANPKGAISEIRPFSFLISSNSYNNFAPNGKPSKADFKTLKKTSKQFFISQFSVKSGKYNLLTKSGLTRPLLPLMQRFLAYQVLLICLLHRGLRRCAQARRLLEGRDGKETNSIICLKIMPL